MISNRFLREVYRNIDRLEQIKPDLVGKNQHSLNIVDKYLFNSYK